MKLYAEKLYKADGTYRRYVLAWHRANPDAVSVDDDLQSAYEAYQRIWVRHGKNKSIRLANGSS